MIWTKDNDCVPPCQYSGISVQIVQTVMSVFISGYPHTIIHDPGDTLIPAPEDTGHWHCRGSRTPSHHPTPTSLYNSVSSEDVPMGVEGAPMNDCIGSLQYWVPLHCNVSLCVHDWYCYLIPALILQHCSTAAAAETLMNADTRYTAQLHSLHQH